MPESSFISLPSMVTRVRASGPFPISVAPLTGAPSLPFSIGVSKAVFREFPAFRLVRDELCVNNLYRWTLYELESGGV